MSSVRVPIVPGAALAVLVVLATGCGAGDELRRSLDAPTPVTAPGPSPATPGTVPPDPGAPAEPCTGDRLAVSLGPPTVSGDTVAEDLIFQNTGPAPCVMRGFPSVVAVAGNAGEAVGEPALPVGERGPQVRLDPRAAATVPLTIRDASAYAPGQCGPTPVRGLRVIPAGGSGAVFVPREGVACATTPPDQPQARVGTATPR